MWSIARADVHRPKRGPRRAAGPAVWGGKQSRVTDGDGRTDLPAWIADLRRRLAQGELDGLAPIDLGNGAPAGGELIVRIMLADLDHLDWLASNAPNSIDVAVRRQRLLYDFHRLRAVIG